MCRTFIRGRVEANDDEKNSFFWVRKEKKGLPFGEQMKQNKSLANLEILFWEKMNRVDNV